MSKILVCFFSTYGIKCGIATYTENLVSSLEKLDDVEPFVFAPTTQTEGALDLPIQDKPVRYAWSTLNNSVLAVINAVVTSGMVVHFQHEYGIFKYDSVFIEALKYVRAKGAKSVVTLHTVLQYGAWDNSCFIDALFLYADLIIVHSITAVAALSASRNYNSNIVNVSHGTPVVSCGGNKERGFDLLEIPKSARNLSFGGSIGFISDGKAIDRTILAFIEAYNRNYIKDCGFIVAGEVPSSASKYYTQIAHLMSKSGVPNLFIKIAFISREDMKHVFAVLDFGILNTVSDALSASGQAHEYIAHGVPLAVVNRPIYRDAIKAGSVVYEYDPHSYHIGLVNTLCAMSRNASLRDTIKQSFARYAQLTSWDNVAKVHVNLYKHILGV